MSPGLPKIVEEIFGKEVKSIELNAIEASNICFNGMLRLNFNEMGGNGFEPMASTMSM